jgi:hypothetical protein
VTRGIHAQHAVRPATRVVGGALVLVLAAASIGLYGWPGETERIFAWTIKPDLTPLLMGAGYASGIVFFFYVTRARSWLEVSFGFVGITVFSTLMLIATVIHWDRFNHDHPVFFAWVLIYAVAPFLVSGLWLYNGGWRRGPVEPPDLEVPRLVRVALGVVGGAHFVVGLVIFVQPSIAVDRWPWDVTPLTARVVAAFTALNVGWAAAALDRRWAAIRIPCLSTLTGWVLLLGAFLRARDDLHGDRAATWIYLGSTVALVALMCWLLASMSLGRAAAPTASASDSA